MQTQRALDRIDFGLLAALQNDARLSNKELAGRVGLAPSSCLARVRRLHELGLIRGHHAELDLAGLGIGLEAIVAIRLGIQTREGFAAVESHLLEMPEVVTVYNVAGADDFLVHVAVRDPIHLRETVVDGITSRDEVRSVETSLIFDYIRVHRLPRGLLTDD